MPLNLPLCLSTAVQAATTAGRLLQTQRSRMAVREKGRLDLVTDVDEAAQACIRDILHNTFPDHGFLGEESTADEHQRGKRETRPLWIVDPIDGTSNYIHGFPFYAVSIALALEREVQVGVIYDPSHDELYQARRDGPALLNGHEMRVTTRPQLEDSLLALGFSTRPDEQARLLQVWQRLSLRTHGLRRTGSAALNLAYVAAGRVDAFYACGVHSWDVAAGILLVEMAGGKVSHVDGHPYDMHRQREIVASNGVLHGHLVSELTTTPESD